MEEIDAIIALSRQERRGRKEGGQIFNVIRRTGIYLNPEKSIIEMPDETDRIFYDTAKSADA